MVDLSLNPVSFIREGSKSTDKAAFRISHLWLSRQGVSFLSTMRLLIQLEIQRAIKSSLSRKETICFICGAFRIVRAKSPALYQMEFMLR